MPRLAAAALWPRSCPALPVSRPPAVPWGELRPAHVDFVRAQLAEHAAPATCNKILSALRGTLRAAWRAGHMEAAVYQLCIDTKGVKGSRLPRGRAVEPEEWRRLFREIG